MKRVALICMGLAMIAVAPQKTVAQDILTEVYTREHIPNKAPVPYAYVREADVMWAKDIYRIIDLKQKQNLPLYYPTKPINDRYNLVQLILWGIDNEGIRAFSIDDAKNEFTIPLDRTRIDDAFGAGTEVIKKLDVNTGMYVDTTLQNDRKTDEVKQLLIKEKWFFDRNHSVMNVRIVGICPIRVYYRTDDQGLPTDLIMKRQTCWVYFPEIRPLLARHEIFNNNNDAQRISFDDYFMQRRFNGYIFAESNVYENRWINSYALGMDALLEADKIKDYLFTMEHDLWEY
ncbi:MAG TPA: gliding motility protein GldN [Bacteroidales bacterium]|nr:gliding motility protein GldN [Bacteroidales bacterium]